MQFQLQMNLRPNVFIPYTTHKRNYYLLFYRYTPKKTKLWVTDSNVLKSETFFRVGDLREIDETGPVVGNIFYTPSASTCYGTAIMAYSKAWAKDSNNTSGYSMPSGVMLMTRTPNFYVYHKKNEVTMIVNPILPQNIRSNLEV